MTKQSEQAGVLEAPDMSDQDNGSADVELLESTIEALRSAGLGEFDRSTVWPGGRNAGGLSPERMAWIARVLRFLDDHPLVFPRGKWATIQRIEEQVDAAALAWTKRQGATGERAPETQTAVGLRGKPPNLYWAPGDRCRALRRIAYPEKSGGLSLDRGDTGTVEQVSADGLNIGVNWDLWPTLVLLVSSELISLVPAPRIDWGPGYRCIALRRIFDVDELGAGFSIEAGERGTIETISKSAPTRTDGAVPLLVRWDRRSAHSMQVSSALVSAFQTRP